MHARSFVGAALGVALAIGGPFGLSVGWSSHPTGNFSQSADVFGDAGEYLSAHIVARSGELTTRLTLFELRDTTAHAGASAGTHGIDPHAGIGLSPEGALGRPYDTTAYAWLVFCSPRAADDPRQTCTWIFGHTTNRTLQYELSTDLVTGETLVRGRLRDHTFAFTLERTERPHPYGNDVSGYSVEPESSHPVWLFVHRYADVGAEMRATSIDVDDLSPVLRWSWAARGHYVHADAYAG